MSGIFLFWFRLHVDNIDAFVAHRTEHPDHIITVLFYSIGEIKAAATTLWPGDDKQVRETMAVQTEESFRAFLLPFISQRTAFPSNNHVKGRGCHPLKACGVNQHVYRILSPVVHDPACVNLAHASRGGIDKMHMRQVKRG